MSMLAMSIDGVVNNSAITSPKPIATWGMMDRTVVANAIEWEILPFHRNARSGRQVACVAVRATDGTTTTGWQNVSATVLSNYCDDAFAPEVYSGSLDISALADDALITLQAKVYPWFGTAGSVLDSATETEFRFGPRYFYRNVARAAAPNVVYVESTGNDSNGVVGTDAVAAAAAPCLTVGGAIVRAAAVLGNASKNTLSGLEVRVVDGVSMGTVGFVRVHQDAAAIKVTKAPGSTRAAANATMGSPFRPFSAGNIQSPELTESALIFDDMTVTMSAAVSYAGESARKMHVQFRNVDYAFANINQTSGMRGNSHLSFFGMAFSNYNGGLNFTTTGDVRTMRGAVGDFNDATAWGYNIFGCDLDNAIILQDRGERGALIYNNHLPDPIGGGNSSITVRAQTSGNDIGPVAVVQNLVPYLRTTNVVAISISADGANGDLTHLVMHHNTTPGDEGFGRWNIAYDDTTGTARTHKMLSCKANLGPQLNTKGDIFKSDATRIGNFPFVHGVGCAANFTEDVDSAGGTGDGFRQTYPGVSTVIAGGDPLYVDDNAMTAAGPTAGTGGGDYTLQAASPARGLLPETLLAFDIAGTARGSDAQDAGAFA